MGRRHGKSKVGEQKKNYSQPAMRRQNQEHRQQQVGAEATSSKSGGSGSVFGSSYRPFFPSYMTKTAKTVGQESLPPVVENSSNFDQFIKCTTPTVPVQFFSKRTMKELKNVDEISHPYFVLGDLWESFAEWNAYGAGVNINLNGNDSPIQYYVPYLSGIQLYVDPSKTVIKQRSPGEDVDPCRASSSNGSCHVDGVVNNVQGTQILNSLSLNINPLKRLAAGETETNNFPGTLVYEYIERIPPYIREPLVDKITYLENRFPDIATYRSSDLTAASWLGVAWYPIYRIPSGPKVLDLEACFLTYHTLSTPLRSNYGVAQSCNVLMPSRMPLPTFASVAYKFYVPFWNQRGDYESPKYNCLAQAAETWKLLLGLEHHDYDFFTDPFKNLDWEISKMEQLQLLS